MADVMEKLKVEGEKAILTAQQYGQIFLQWNMKLFKKQQRKIRQRCVARKAQKVFGDFGLEVYRLIKEGVTDLQNVPSIKEKLEQMKLAESDMAKFDQFVEEIERAFEEKKREIQEKFEHRKKELHRVSSNSDQKSEYIE